MGTCPVPRSANPAWCRLSCQRSPEQALGPAAHSPYLLRDLVKVEELEMLYAEFRLGTRATEEPSVTCRQRWHGQAVTRGHAHEERAHGREKPAQEG